MTNRRKLRWSARARSDDGVSMVVFAIFLVVVLMFAGIALDLSNARQERRQAQNAADASALAAVAKLDGSASQITNAVTAAKNYALSNFNVSLSAWASCTGYTPLSYQTSPASSCISFDSGTTPKQARVTLPTTSISTMFAGFAGLLNVNVTASATAEKGASSGASGPAILTLNPTAAGSFDLAAGAVVTVTGGGVVVNSNNTQAMKATSGVSLTVNGTGTVQVRGGCKSSGSSDCADYPSTPAPTQVTTLYPDPYSTLPAVPDSYCTGKIDSTTTYTASVTFTPRCWNSKLTLGPGAAADHMKVVLQPGIYVLNGLDIKNYVDIEVGTSTSTDTGAGVLLYNKSGAISLSTDDIISLKPPTIGDYQNVALFQARTNTNTFTVSGSNPTVDFGGGVVYMPAGTLSFTATDATWSNGGVIVDSLSVAGTTSLSGTTPCSTGCSGGGEDTYVLID